MRPSLQGAAGGTVELLKVTYEFCASGGVQCSAIDTTQVLVKHSDSEINIILYIGLKCCQACVNCVRMRPSQRGKLKMDSLSKCDHRFTSTFDPVR